LQHGARLPSKNAYSCSRLYTKTAAEKRGRLFILKKVYISVKKNKAEARKNPGFCDFDKEKPGKSS
jgi:hypothetical protein